MANLAVKLGLLGSALGLLAGFIELTVGAQIRPWIGNKENPVVLGFVTLSLSAIAFVSVVSARSSGSLTNDAKLAIFLGLLFPAAICFTTVGRLWYLPGALLTAAAFLFAYQYWFRPSSIDSFPAWSGLVGASRLIGTMGGVIILAAVGLGFWKSQLGLFHSEVFLKGEPICFDILPMDFVRRTSWSGNVPMVDEFEVTRVMIIHILLLVGAVIAILAGLTTSRLFMSLGSLVIFIGLTLFMLWLPGILAQANYVPNGYLSVISSLGWEWWISLFGMSLILIASLLRLHPN